MKPPEFNLVLDEARWPKEQIREFVREEIRRQQLRAGTRLPSTEALAKQWGTPGATIHAALTELVKEGWLVRLHGRGTFVQQRQPKLTRVGIYHPGGVFAPGGSEFMRAVHAQLRRLLARAGIEVRVWIDPRAEAEQARPWPALVRAIQRRELQALLLPQTDWPHLRWQSRLGVPIAFLGSANLPYSVYLDLGQFTELGLRRLGAQGCRSVGLITPIWAGSRDPSGQPHEHYRFTEHFLAVAAEAHLRLSNAWMRFTKRADELNNQARPEWGYREFQRLWQQRKRPDGLVVTEDVVAQGVIAAILERGVRVPQELKLVLHKNAGIPLLCPLPATFVVSSERECAAALIAQVQKQFRGESCEPIRVPFRLMAHRGNS